MTNTNRGKTIVLTGGSGGIGMEIAKYFLDHMIINLDRDTLMGVENIKVDLASTESIDKAVGHLYDAHVEIDAFINSAGIYQCSDFDRFSLDDFMYNLQVNLIGPTYLAKQVTPLFREDDEAKTMVFISSGAAFLGSKDVGYSASKHGILGVTKSLAKNLTERNIQVYGVAPGVIETPMSQIMPEKRKQDHIDKTMEGRLGTPQEVAKLVHTLVTSELSYMSGQTFHINGGLYLG